MKTKRKRPDNIILAHFERSRTSVSDGRAAASLPCTGCPPAAGSVENLASPECHNNGTWSCLWKRKARKEPERSEKRPWQQCNHHHHCSPPAPPSMIIFITSRKVMRLQLSASSYLVPRRRVRRPMNTERISFPKDAALTGSSFCSWQCRR